MSEKLKTETEDKIEYTDAKSVITSIHWDLGFKVNRVLLTPKSTQILLDYISELEKPVDLILFCPNCGKQHIDKPEPSIYQDCGAGNSDHRTGEDNGTCPEFTAWLNPPHKSHRCNFCNHVWRPADVATNGIREIKTKGENDSSFEQKNNFCDLKHILSDSYETKLENLLSENPTLERLLYFTQTRGQSVTLNFGEDNSVWECSFITGGERFTAFSRSAKQAVIECLKKTLEK